MRLVLVALLLSPRRLGMLCFLTQRFAEVFAKVAEVLEECFRLLSRVWRGNLSIYNNKDERTQIKLFRA